MSKHSLKLQAISLRGMAARKPFLKKLAGITYFVLPKVYQGSTDTELLCETLDLRKGEDLWDVGTGTGLVALYAKKKGAGYVLATDKNPAAVQNAKRNSGFLDLHIEVRRADVFGSINTKFDVITFNPPFTDHRAKQSHEISFWDKGHVSIKKFFGGLGKRLNSRGRAFICWASFGDPRKLKRLAKEAGYSLLEAGKRKGKNGFTYYAYRITPNSHG